MFHEIKLYLEIIKNTIKSNTAYKASLFCFLLFRFIALFASISIWRALYDKTDNVSSSIGNISLNNMVAYVILSTSLSIIITNDVIRQIHQKISSGEIAMDLIKPISLKLVFLCQTIGNNIIKFTFQIIPFLIISILFFRMEAPTWQNLIFFVLSIINAVVINFLLFYLMGLMGFWYLSVNHLSFFLSSLVTFFSGAVVPLWFFPKTLHFFANFLPFKLIYFVPINIFLNKITFKEIVLTLLLQILWIGILLVFERILWSRGIKKLVIQGG